MPGHKYATLSSLHVKELIQCWGCGVDWAFGLVWARDFLRSDVGVDVGAECPSRLVWARVCSALRQCWGCEPSVGVGRRPIPGMSLGPDIAAGRYRPAEKALHACRGVDEGRVAEGDEGYLP